MRLPPLAARLLADAELLADPAPVDLREMSKFDELPNVAGLAAHRLESPCPGGDASVAEPLNMSLDRLVGQGSKQLSKSRRWSGDLR